jgi:hypothetical protein
MALAMGALFAVNAFFMFATGVGGWFFGAASLGLIVGGYRTLRKMSGGLRLLAGAWGIAAGLLMLPLGALRNSVLHDTYYVAPSLLSIVFLLVALLGLALTVLHKEK